ncbi:MAG: ankyrin repeat domain-containing protein [Thermoanaerobaculia bacterium]
MLGLLKILGAIVALIGGLLGLRQTLLFWYRHKLVKLGIPPTLEEFHKRVPFGDRRPWVMELFLKAGLKAGLDASTEKGDTGLLIAARSGQENTARLFLRKRKLWKGQLRKGADPAGSDNWGFTPITAAVLGGHDGVRDALIEAGLPAEAVVGPGILLAARRGDLPELRRLIDDSQPEAISDDLETAAEDGSTPLIEAAQRAGNSEVVDALLEAGVEKNAHNLLGSTALMAAARGDAADCVRALIDARVDLEAVDNVGQTAYVIAVRAGHGAVMKLLEDAGASTVLPPELAPKYDIVDAINRGLVDEVRKLFAKLSSRPAFDPNMRLPDGRTLLQALIDAKAINEVKDLILKRGADPNQASNDGTTPVQAAIDNEDPEATRVLVKAGANTGVSTKEGDSLLGVAIDTGSTELVDALLEGIDVDQRGRNGATALLVAARKGNLPLVQRLLKEEPAVDAPDDFGATPLMTAVLDQNQPIEEALVAAGAKRGKAEALLIRAAAQGDVDKVGELLEAGAEVNVVGSRERSAVLEAVRYGRQAVLDQLLALEPPREPDLELTGPKGNTPLMIAAAAGRVGMARQLIEADVKIQTQSRDGHTALMLACRRGQTEVVALLLAEGAQVDTRRRDGRDALLLAVENGDPRIAELLIDRDAKVVNATSRRGESPLMLAILLGNSKMVELLKGRGAERGQAEAELFMAARRGDTQEIERLLAEHTPVDARLKGKKTPLLEAIDNNKLEAVRLLTAADADVNDTEWQRKTPLLRAAGRGREGIVKHLLGEDASANVPGPNDQTPLMAACQGNHFKTAKALVANGANVNARDRLGRTPLMIAILEDRPKLIKLLKKKDATEGESDARLIQATRIGNQAQVKYWLSQGADADAVGVHRERPLVEACKRGAYGIAKELLEQGADANGTATAGTRPLTAAAAGSSAELIDLLIEHKADIEGQGSHQRTALMVAAEEGREASDPSGESVLEALLRHGANVNARDVNADSALILAAAAGKLEALGTLVDAPGIAIDAAGEERRTALMAAAVNGHGNGVARLLAQGAAVDARDVNDSTALILAAPKLEKNVIRILLGRDPEAPRADPNARDALGNTPLMGAMLAGNTRLSRKIVRLLRNFGAREGSVEAELLVAAEACDTVRVKELLSGRINVDARRPGEDPALVVAAWCDCDPAAQEDVILALVGVGADVRLKGRWGRTALMGVARAGNQRLVQALLDSGADDVLEAVEDRQDLLTLNTATTLADTAGKSQTVDLLAQHDALRPEDSVLLLTHGDKYHLGGCAFARAAPDHTSLAKALEQGRRPCHFCLPKQ